MRSIFAGVLVLCLPCVARSQQETSTPAGASAADRPGASAAPARARIGPQPRPPAPDPCVNAQANPLQGPVEVVTIEELRRPCMDATDPYRRFLDTSKPYPLTPRQKGLLAIRDLTDPFNFITIAGNSAITVASDSHSAYGPGLRGFGRNLGYSYLGDATSEFIGTFAVCSLAHQDPHYHRMPEARPMRRVLHAVGRTVIAQHDDGRTMPNYANLINYAAGNLLANLYVPGVHTSASATAQRIGIGLATDPTNNLVTEFLPDVARRVHIRVVFVQRILNSALGVKEQPGS